MWLRPLHEILALTGLGAIGLHGFFLFIDSWLRPGLAGILIPFASPWRPLPVALGVIAAYLSLLLGPTYYLRNRIGAKRWRSLHRLAPAVYGLAVLHVLLAGSDAGSLWLRLAVGCLTGPIIGLTLLRVLDSRSPARDDRMRRSPPSVPTS
jgi:sulfoxide reductase heme-binding subunit YedZ